MPSPARILGRGFAFPVLPIRGSLSWIDGYDAVEQAMWTLLLTEPGERIGRPRYGVGLKRFLYAPNSVATRTQIRKAVEEAIGGHEPRVSVDAIDVYSVPPDDNELRIDIRYTAAGQVVPKALVFPFYLDNREA